MNDLISREAAIEAAYQALGKPSTSEQWGRMLVALKDIPQAQGSAMNDLISRKAVMSIPLMPRWHRKYQTCNLDDAYDEGWGDYQACVSQVPPAKLWIPVSERLPEISDHIDDMVIVCDSEGKIRFDAYNNGWCYCPRVVAWMPLPKPYQGGV